MKKKIAVLLAVYVLILSAGLALNLQRGLYVYQQFWKLKGDHTYVHACGDEIRYNADSGVFELDLDGKRITATRGLAADGSAEFVFSDGWSMVLTDSPALSVEIDGMQFSGGLQIVLTDLAAGGYRFEAAAEPVIELFYDENGAVMGEIQTLLSESGEYIDSVEIRYDHPEYTTGKKDVVVLKDGMTVASDDIFGTLYRNENGEYLMNPESLFFIRAGNDQISRRELIGLLEKAMNGQAVHRGEPWAALLYTALYWLGAAQLLWPEQMAFFGTRWQFRQKPELSDAGLLFACCGAVVMMLLSAALLLVPVFG